MTSNKSNFEKPSPRRAFFRQLALLGGVIALRPFSGSARAQSGKSGPAAEDSHAGYRLTEHIRRYYERAAE